MDEIVERVKQSFEGIEKLTFILHLKLTFLLKKILKSR